MVQQQLASQRVEHEQMLTRKRVEHDQMLTRMADDWVVRQAALQAPLGVAHDPVQPAKSWSESLQDKAWSALETVTTWGAEGMAKAKARKQAAAAQEARESMESGRGGSGQPADAASSFVGSATLL